MRPKRQDKQAGDFEDPLSNYDPPVFADPLEESLTDALTELDTTPVEMVASSTTVGEAITRMSDRNIASVLIVDDGKLKGIFSERDVLYGVSDRFEQIKNDPVTTVMTANPQVAYESDTPAKALNLMVTGGFRHVPILDADDNVIGIIGPRRVTRYLQKHLQMD